MKGLVFREFLEMVEAKYGYKLVDEILNENKLVSKGAYTSVGTYNHEELTMLVDSLSKKTKTEISELLKQYGIHLFSVFVKKYSDFFFNISDAFSFLSNVEETIHVEVLKLYPEAELPTFIVITQSEDKMIMEYSSERKLADFAEGLMMGCINHFKENITISKAYLTEDKSKVEFILTKDK